MNYTLKPGEELPAEKLQELQAANDKFSKNQGNLDMYREDLCKIFNVTTHTVNQDSKHWIAGFMEGEASLNVSAKKLKTAKFGMLVDPEFSITQHVNGVSSLLLAHKILNAGRIRPLRDKSGSNATLVLVIYNRKALEEKVLPFYQKYVKTFSSQDKNERLAKFTTLLDLFKNNKHTDLNSFLNEILPVWDELRKQKGQSNETFSSLEAAQQYVREFVSNKT